MSKDTYYRWRKEFGGMQIDQVKKLKDLEKENARLKKLVADQALDLSILIFPRKSGHENSRAES
ncbi:MAG: transposase [Bdellovibrionales bacterium]|nr:transposase [Bdellovibrionales bacterium]